MRTRFNLVCYLARRLAVCGSQSVICSRRSFFTSNLRPSQKIYTKTGDKGTSALFTGERRAKYDGVFEALGVTDELSSFIGLAMAHADDAGLTYGRSLENIQCVLQDIGTVLATPESSARDAHKARVHFSDEYVQNLELQIDEMTTDLPPLTNFILPSGSKAAASLHVARSVCRRAERRVAMLKDVDNCDTRPLVYLNRLSDYLFTLARYAAWEENKPEIIYRRPT